MYENFKVTKLPSSSNLDWNREDQWWPKLNPPILSVKTFPKVNGVSSLKWYWRVSCKIKINYFNYRLVWAVSTNNGDAAAEAITWICEVGFTREILFHPTICTCEWKVVARLWLMVGRNDFILLSFSFCRWKDEDD